MQIGKNPGFMTGAFNAPTEWSLSVFDSQNREFLSMKGVSPEQRFSWKFTDPKAFVIEIGRVMSLTLSGLAREWGMMLYSSEEMLDQINNGEKMP